jgi:hypothetical protein
VITVTRRRPEAPGAPPGAFARVATQLDALVAALGLGAQAPLIRAVYGAICRRALAFPLGGGPTASSRLNEDGMPVQFATTVGPHPAALRFIVDPGSLDAEGGARMCAARATMCEAAELIGAEAELAALAPFLSELVPEVAPALRADPAGAFWIGAAFAPGAAPRLRVYVNGGWGSPAAQSARLRRFAAHFRRAEAWDDLAAQFPPVLAPLGFALTLAPGGRTRGAIYLRAFGLRLCDYAALARAASGQTNAERIRAFGAALLGADAAYPTPSAILSFGFGSEPGLPAELEFCAHCLYADDTAAQTELERLFASIPLDPAPYRALARALAPPAPRPGPPHLHSFIGADTKSAGTAYAVYMKPDLFAPDDARS